MKHNKQSIDKKIAALEEALVMESHIRAVMDKFKHYKLVNIKFINALKEDGRFHAYIVKDDYSTILTIYTEGNFGDNRNDRVEFRMYLSHCMTEKKLITWEGIDKELVRHAFKERLDDCIDMRNSFDEEKKKFEELHSLVKASNFKCFDLYTVKRELEDILNYANAK